MTIGEKITHLRIANKISQEQLAEKLGVSRQSVSKWEMDQSLPHIDKVLLICELFSVSADELLHNDIVIHRDTSGSSASEDGGAPRGNKYFGTDGFRGEANVSLTSEQAYKVGRFLGWYFASPLSGCRKPGYRPRIVIGKDTRRSSYMLEYSIVAGLTASGADVYMLHVTTTPSVSYVTKQDEFDCGVMISASHNPYYDNGIKLVNRYGEKIDDAAASLIEAYVDGDMARLGIDGDDLPLARRERIGCIVDYVAGRNRYVGYLISVASHSYRNLRVGLDCANGASWMIAKAVFDALGAQTYVIGASPDGTNINSGFGSTHTEALREFVRENHLDLGFAFDGDADRCIAVDEKGNEVNGDHILYILAKRLKERGNLDGNTVVATVMSNSGLINSLEAEGIHCAVTAVGDRFVYECMQQNGYRLGGEQSGHIILQKYATTGDGILTAIMITEEMLDNKTTLSKLTKPVKLYPQLCRSIKVTSKSAVMADEEVKRRLSEINDAIGGRGRVLLRESGTEPVIRIMVECESADDCEAYAGKLAAVIKKRGYCCE
ncbi:MAG: phosphoglucosamine mutase [Eubacteriales bacterium]|nr:phosphoglucosamine mutase [Clostridiales bacterium]MDD7594387.1 phosphoglucosamine mutase [Clostridiales bacterium]MDY4887536.1 phosphoglucosamine mutase [Eubacteriales bacterium]MDY5859593.1 phosphoglucosamine mutase [Eubacteriales bacterium]